MGACCSMEVDLEEGEEVLPPPDPSAEHMFCLENLSAFSKDYVVRNAAGQKWMVVDQEGKFWEDDMVTTLETFDRNRDGGDKGCDGKIGSGLPVVCAVLDKLSYDNYDFGDYDEHVDTDPSDYSTCSSCGEDDVDAVERKEKCKWKCKTKAHFYETREYVNGKPRPAGAKIATLKIKAKGKAKQKTTVVETEMEDGSKHTDYEIKKKVKVKKFFYKLTFEGADEEVPIEVEGNWNHGDRGLRWHSPGFEAKVASGFLKPRPQIHVAGGTGHPGLWLLIGFMASINLSPTDVLQNCNPPFKGARGLDP